MTHSHLIYTFVLATLGSLATLMSSQSHADQLYMPVLARCRATIDTYLDNFPEHEGQYVSFDVRIDSHDDIVGFVTFKGSGFRLRNLEQLRNTMTATCATNSEVTIPREDNDALEELMMSLKYDLAEGGTTQYIVVTDESIKVYKRGRSR